MASEGEQPKTDKAQEPKKTGLALADIEVLTGDRGLELASLDGMYRFAKHVAESGLAPKGLANNPSAILVCLQHGLEVGLKPMQAMRGIMVVNNRPSLWGDALLAVCRQAPMWDGRVYEETIEGEGDNRVAKCTVGRKGEKPITRTFSVEDAKTAGLWGKDGTWKKYPARMLGARARGFALRDAFPDVLSGMVSYEEAQDYIDVEATVVEPQPAMKKPEPLTPMHNEEGEVVGQVRKKTDPQDAGELCPEGVESDTEEGSGETIEGGAP